MWCYCWTLHHKIYHQILETETLYFLWLLKWESNALIQRKTYGLSCGVLMSPGSLLCLCSVWRVSCTFSVLGNSEAIWAGSNNGLFLTCFLSLPLLQALAHKTLVLLLGVDPSRQLDHPLPTVHPQVTYAYMKHMWKSARKVQESTGRAWFPCSGFVPCHTC